MSPERPAAGGHRIDVLASPQTVAGERPPIVPVTRVAAAPPVAFNAPEPAVTASIPIIDRPDASTLPAFVRATEAEVETRPRAIRSDQDAGWRLRLPDGSTHPLEHDTLLGREPVRDDGVRRILVPDCELGVSRVHARLRVRGGLLTIEDLGSTNGTYLVDEDGRETRLPVGEVLPMPLGWRLDLANVRLELWAQHR